MTKDPVYRDKIRQAVILSVKLGDDYAPEVKVESINRALANLKIPAFELVDQDLAKTNSEKDQTMKAFKKTEKMKKWMKCWEYELEEPDAVTGNSFCQFDDITCIMLEFYYCACQQVLKSSQVVDYDVYEKVVEYRSIPVKDRFMVDVIDCVMYDHENPEDFCYNIRRNESRLHQKLDKFENPFENPSSMKYDYKKWGWLGKTYMNSKITARNVTGLPSWREIKNKIIMGQIEYNEDLYGCNNYTEQRRFSLLMKMKTW